MDDCVIAFSTLQNQQAVFTQAMEDTPTVEQPFNLHLSCPSLTIVLRWVSNLVEESFFTETSFSIKPLY